MPRSPSLPRHPSYPHPTVVRLSDAGREHGRATVRWAVRSGRWQVLPPRVLVLHNGPLSEDELRRAAVCAGPPGTLLAGATALLLHGLHGLGEPEVHVTIPHSARTFRRPDVVVHRSLVREGEPGIGDPPRTTVERSVVDAASWAANDRLARAYVLASVQQRLTTPERLQDALAVRGPVRRTALVRESILDAAGGVESLPEADFARIVRRAGLPEPSRQSKVRTGAGSFRLDVSFDPWRVDVEIDGAHHRDVGQSARDLRRQNEIVIAGRNLLRFDSYQVRHEASSVAAVLSRALSHAGWPRLQTSRS